MNHDFILTTRSDNYAWGIRDFDDTLKRLQAFEQACADVLYPPAFDDLTEIKHCCDMLNNPVNVLVQGLNESITLQDLGDAEVKRISLGSGMYLAAMGGFMASITELQDPGTFHFLSNLAD
ncbi:MAG: isocitrate lyase/phosphoenolpyruvate mutase family protein [Acidiferrobacterales bacterium]|nr:isocitrate lyase/phosphoenolpyruvate mutase family protein [Acidiferrobacterales bacterium]